MPHLVVHRGGFGIHSRQPTVVNLRLRAQVREVLSRPGSGENTRQVEDADVRQRTRHAGLLDDQVVLHALHARDAGRYLAGFLLELGHAFQPAHPGDAVKIPAKFHMRGDR